MGLTTWKDAPDGKVMLSDTKVAKNYLSDDEISELNRIVNMYLDYAENLASRHKAMSMNDWAERLDKFLEFNEYQILHGRGRVSRKAADEFVKNEFEKFNPIQDKNYKSDYNKFEEKQEVCFLKNKINFMTFILGFYERIYFEQLSGEDVDYYNERIRHFENGDYKGAIKIDLDALKLSLM